MVEEGETKGGDQNEIPAGLPVALFMVAIVASVAMLSVLLVSNLIHNRLLISTSDAVSYLRRKSSQVH